MAEWNITITTGAQGAPGQGVPAGGTTGQFLKKMSGADYDTEWATSSATVASINDINDVDVTGVANGEVLKFNSTSGNWEAAVDDTGATATWGNITGTLSNQTDLQTALDGKSDTSHNHSGVYAPASHTHVEADITDLQSYLLDITGENIGSLANVDTTGAVNGKILKYNGSTWVVSDDTGDAAVWGNITGTLSAQTDLQAALDGKATSAQGSLADTATQPGDNISTLVNDSGFITSYTVTEGDVTAHEAALTITESQISDLGSYLTDAPSDGSEYVRKDGAWAVVSATGGGTWGSITGTLSNQTDLQAALDAKAASSHTHVEADITDLGAYITDITGENIDDLADVNTTGKSDGQALVWNAGFGEWRSATVSSGGVTDHGALTGLGDDDHAIYHTDARGDARYYTQAQVTSQLAGKAEVIHVHGIPDVSGLQTALDGKATAAQGALADSAMQPGANPITDLSDVVLTNPANGNALLYSGGDWVNGSYSHNHLADVDGNGTIHLNLTEYNLINSALQSGDNVSTLTNDSGYITDYTVTQGDVTTHEAALTITESQISDLGSYLTDAPSDGNDYVRNNGAWSQISATSGSLRTEKTVSATAHGFTTGTAVYFNGTIWTRALANNANTLATHIVEVVDSNNFVAVLAGSITTLSGLTPGAAYYVSNSVTGGLTSVEPSTGYSNPVGVAVSATELIVIPFRAAQIGGAGGGAVDSVDGRTGVVTLDDLYAPISHTHSIANVTGLQTALDGKATAAQGALADSATQPGDNISSLTNDSGFITSYTVTQGDVTTHQAALTITESQISDLGSYLTDAPSDGNDYVRNNGAWAVAGGISDVVEDTTPQLGGDLDTAGFALTDTTGAFHVTVKPRLEVDGRGSGLGFSAMDFYPGTTGCGFYLKDEADANAGIISYKHTTDEFNIQCAQSGGPMKVWHQGTAVGDDLEIYTSGSGQLKLEGITYPKVNGNNGDVLTSDGAGNATWQAAASGGAPDYIHLQHKTAYNVEGGSYSPAYTWQTRPLNTEVSDEGGHCTLSGNEFTLAAGTYDISYVGNHKQDSDTSGGVRAKARLYNVTDASVELEGLTESEYRYYNFQLVVQGRITLATSKTLRIEHACSDSDTGDGFGVPHSTSGWGDNIFADLTLRKVA